MTPKRLILVLLLLAGMVLGYLFYLSWAAGFVVSKYCGGKHDGESGRIRSIVISWRNSQLHLHHWMFATAFLAAGALGSVTFPAPGLFYGFLAGAAFQGIYCYGDWYRILRRRARLPALTEPPELGDQSDTGPELA